MNIFLTGGTGFIGSYVVNDLVQKGHKVTILARNPKKVKGFLGNPSIEFVKGTLYERDIIEKAMKDKDACIHIALGWGNTAVDLLEADTKPSVFILETAAKLGVKKVIYTSSTAAVGELSPMMHVTSAARPIDLYGATKAATEAYVLSFGSVPGLCCNIIRPGYTFGNPVVDGASMENDQRFFNIVRKAKNNEPVKLIKNDGTQFIWAGDLAKLYIALLESDLNRKVFFGLGSEFVTWEEIARYAIEYTDSRSEIVLEDKGWAEGGFLFDVSDAEQSFELTFDSRDKLKEHVRYISDHI